MAGELVWYKARAIWPVRFTHDVDGYSLLNQPGRRRSRWLESILRCDGTTLNGPAYRPLPLQETEK